VYRLLLLIDLCALTTYSLSLLNQEQWKKLKLIIENINIFIYPWYLWSVVTKAHEY
jgi:hypothetical protein